MTLVNFNSESDISNWRILDDVVMGGRSDGHFKINSDGHGEFTGDISLENNGGFSSLRYDLGTINTPKFTKFVLKIKGDGKTYQFRVKDKSSNRHSYVYEFETTIDW